MKRARLALLVPVLLLSCAMTPAPASRVASAEEAAAHAVVTRRVAAYNAHDIEAFLATYADDVRIYIYPERLLGTGRERMRRIFGPQFARGDGQVAVRSQYALDDKIVSVEDVTIAGSVERNIAIYTVTAGHIAEVRLIEPGE